MNRRDVIKASVLGMSMLAFTRVWATQSVDDEPAHLLAALEKRHGGRLGVAILDTATGRQWGHRASERFLMCSTFKLLAAAAVLARVDRGEEQLDRRMIFDKSALLAHAPITREHVGEPGMTIAALCEAAVTVSDNTAANLLLSSLDGPAGLTRYVRGLGDSVTRLDRMEPELNVGSPGDVRDTTTPHAMLLTMRQLLVGDALSQDSRTRLLGWLRACSTGMDKLRSGIPANWQAGDKTGSGSHGETNDVAILWPPGRKPLLISCYLAVPDSEASQRSKTIAAVGSLAATLSS